MSSITVFRFLQITLCCLFCLCRVHFTQNIRKNRFIFWCFHCIVFIFVCYIITHVYSAPFATFIFVSMSCFPFFRIICYILFEHFLCHANTFTHIPDFAVYLEANNSFDCSPFFFLSSLSQDR